MPGFRVLACGLLGLLVCPGMEVGAADDLRVQARVAWGGYARPGSWTEIVLRVVAAEGGPLEVEARGGDVRVIWRGSVEAGVERSLALPVYVGPAGALRVDVRGSDGAKRPVVVDLRPLARGERLVAWVSARALPERPLDWTSGTRLVHLLPEQVPVSPRAFEQPGVLVVEAAAARQLAPLARLGIDRHLEQCRRLLAVGLGAAELRDWRARAGCDGAAFAAVDEAPRVASAVVDLLAVEPPGLFESAELREFSPLNGPTARSPLIAFFAAYGVILLLSSVLVRRAWLLAIVPLAAAALLLAAFGSSRSGLSLVTWAETTSGSHVARFAALLRVDGLARGHTTLRLPDGLGPPDLGPAGGELLLGEGSGADSLLRLRTALLSEQRLLLRGAVAWSSPLLLEHAARGPRVANSSSATSAPAWLIWDSDFYLGPALEPGSDWTPLGVEPSARPLLPRPLANRTRALELGLLLHDASALLPGLAEFTVSEWTFVGPGETK